MHRSSPEYLERKATALLSAHLTLLEKAKQTKRAKASQKRQSRYNRSLASNQWAVTK